MISSDIPKNYLFIELKGEKGESKYYLRQKFGKDSSILGAIGLRGSGVRTKKIVLEYVEAKSIVESIIENLYPIGSIKPGDNNPTTLRELKDKNITVFHLTLPLTRDTESQIKIIESMMYPEEEFPCHSFLSHMHFNELAKACSYPESFRKPRGFAHNTMRQSLLKIWDMIQKRKGEELFDKPEKRARIDVMRAPEMSAMPPVGMYDAPIYSDVKRPIEPLPYIPRIEMDESHCYREVHGIIPKLLEKPVVIKEEGWEEYDPEKWEPRQAAPIEPTVGEDGWQHYDPDNFK